MKYADVEGLAETHLLPAVRGERAVLGRKAAALG
jgi:hypothetical protein